MKLKCLVCYLAGMLLLSLSAKADFHLLELNEAYIDYYNFSALNPNAINALTFPDPPKEAVNVGLNIDVAHYFYLNSLIEGTTTSQQYRGIGLQIRFGIRLSDQFDVGIYHHSQHAIDRGLTTVPGFYTEDAINVRFNLYKSGKKDSLF